MQRFLARSSGLQSKQLRLGNPLRSRRCKKPTYFFFFFLSPLSFFLPITLFCVAVSHLKQQNAPLMEC